MKPIYIITGVIIAFIGAFISGLLFMEFGGVQPDILGFQFNGKIPGIVLIIIGVMSIIWGLKK